MTDKFILNAAFLHAFGKRLDHQIAVVEAIRIIVRLKIIQIHIDDRETLLSGYHMLYLFIDDHIARKPG